jgi:hypothetical protein
MLSQQVAHRHAGMVSKFLKLLAVRIRHTFRSRMGAGNAAMNREDGLDESGSALRRNYGRLARWIVGFNRVLEPSRLGNRRWRAPNSNTIIPTTPVSAVRPDCYACAIRGRQVRFV